MSLSERHAELSGPGANQAIFILDASESAQDCQGKITALVQGAVSGLPSNMEWAVSFLGSSSRYPSARFTTQSDVWFRENRPRASLVTPILESLPPEDSAIVVIIGAGRIFDLQDWEGSPVLHRVLLVNVGGSPLQEERIAEELTSPAPEELFYRLHDPVTGVRIQGEGFMPTFWNNPGYHLEIDEQGRVLLIADRLKEFSVKLRCFAKAGARIRSVLSHASGKQTERDLTTLAQAPELTENVALTPREMEALRIALKEGRFTCPQCGKDDHDPMSLHCPGSGFIRGMDELIYPTLRGTKGFGVFRIEADAVLFSKHAGDVLRLGVGRVALKKESTVCIYRFDESKDTWVQTDQTLTTYYPLDENTYGVFLG